jgi:DNA-binding NarL/FixJ family response regulator
MRLETREVDDKQVPPCAEARAGQEIKAGKPATIQIVDDHVVVRRALSTLLAKSTAWTVCGEAINARDAIEKAGQLQPDVILLDISLPDGTGLEAAPEILEVAPQAKIVIVSQHEPKQMLARALASGAHAYVTKSDLSRDLFAAIREVLGPESF